MVFKCKICGGSLKAEQGNRVAICEYCGIKQTLPSTIEPNAQEIYNRANAYLMHHEFDKAENLYNQILFDNKSDADVYWNILMCRYGVTYVKDPASGRYVPTCNRTLYKPIFSDDNYRNAIKFGNYEQQALYEENAKTIDKIQQGILSVSKKEKPFDIFISYKETSQNGSRTRDSIKAQELYDKLTAEGYKVFFSRITLEDKIGTEYEPYIYAALASSKVMITISSSKENIEAVWVKNEWSRFMSFMAKDSSKTIIPLYFDMEKTDLPEDFSNISSYDINIDGFEQDLIRGIKKLIPTPVMLDEKRKKFRKKLKVVGVAAFVLVIIGAIASIPWFIKLPEYNAAMQLYYDKNYPEATWAFADLGRYRNSEEMQDKCERSWRNSLANVVSDDYIGRISRGACYITADGSVKNVPNYGIFENLPKINEHGKIISISLGFPKIYALYEDGYVLGDNIPEATKWENIIQISDIFNSTNIALTSEGKLIYGDLYNGLISDTDDAWIKEVSEWEDIASFDCCIQRLNGQIYHAGIVGVKADGTICISTDEKEKLSIAEDEIKKFKNVKSANITVYQTNNSNSEISVNITALTKDGKLQVYADNKFMEIKNEYNTDIVSIALSFYPYINALTSDGKYFYNNELKGKDIIYLNSYYSVTRTGKITVNDTDIYTYVHDEWLERMN